MSNDKATKMNFKAEYQGMRKAGRSKGFSKFFAYSKSGYSPGSKKPRKGTAHKSKHKVRKL